MTFVLTSERQAGVAMLKATNTSLDGDQVLTHGLPAGFGDCAVLGVMNKVVSIATMVADPETLGPAVRLEAAGSTAEADPLFAEYWKQSSASRLAVAWEPVRPVYMRAEELVAFEFSEVDTNVSPTCIFQAFIRVRRLRDLSPGERQAYLRGQFGA